VRSTVADQNRIPVPAVRTRKTAVQSLVNATQTVVTFDAEDYKTDPLMHDNTTNPSRLTVITAGKYRIQATVVFAASATGGRAVVFRKNGATYLGGAHGAANSIGTEDSAVSASTTADLAVGDYVECQAYQVSGGALNVNVASGAVGIPTHFGMERLS
jgi:hypothetical protein